MKLIPSINANLNNVKERMQKLKFDECEVLFWKKDSIHEEIIKIKEISNEVGVKISSVHIPNYAINKNKNEIGELSKILDFILNSINPKNITMHSLYGNLEIMKKNLSKILDQFSNKQFKFTIENLSKSKANIHDTESAKKFLEGLNYENFGLCMDTSHFLTNKYITPEELNEEIINFITTFGSKIKHIHISDVLIKDRIVYKHLPIGTGIINWDNVKENLIKIGYNGYITIEYLPEYEEEMKEAIDLWNLI